jgi:hypothetical protein
VPSCLLLGCSDNSETMHERQERLLGDPFSYKMDDNEQDVSGGTISELDRDALRKDIDSVLNP